MPMFEVFWQAYPRRVSKGAAVKAWKKLKPSAELLQRMLEAIEYQKAWRKKAEKVNSTLPAYKRIFVPPWKHAGTWINQECWLDEHDEPETNTETKPRKTMCTTCEKEEGKYQVADSGRHGIFYCIRCY